jgi:guanosine-3',5'-bis(diphosphate) 3'-pyrophosphohydrolase
MAKDFYYQVMGEVFGPLTGIELRERAVAGDVTTDTLVRVEADGEWVYARRLKNLFDKLGRPIPHEQLAPSPLGSDIFHEVEHGVPPELLLLALSFAARAHEGQKRKDGQTPYIAHPMRVTTILHAGFGVTDPEVLAAAALHDVIEDTTTDHDDLVKHFGKRVATMVATLTKDKRLPEEEREEVYLHALGQAQVDVQLCKLADAYDNLLDAAGLPKKEQNKLVRKANRLLDEFSPNFPKEWSHSLDLLRSLVEKGGGLIRPHADADS